MEKKDNEDNLLQDDILYKFNREILLNKNKSEIISALKSINQVCELKIFRKKSATLSDNDSLNKFEIPYYSSIFAKNSIKLAVRSSNYNKQNALNTMFNKSKKKLLDFLSQAHSTNDENGK